MEEGKDAITSLALSVAFKVLSEATMSIWHTPCHSHYSVPASRACFLLPLLPYLAIFPLLLVLWWKK